MAEDPLVDRLIGKTAGRLWLGVAFLIVFLLSAGMAPSRFSFWLALGLYGALHHWVIEEPAQGQFPDAFLYAIAAIPVTLLAFTLYHWGR